MTTLVKNYIEAGVFARQVRHGRADEFIVLGCQMVWDLPSVHRCSVIGSLLYRRIRVHSRPETMAYR